MIYQESATNPLPSRRYFGDFRTGMKIMAGVLRVREEVPRDRRTFMRRVTEKVCEGDPTLHELTRWYGQAITLVRREA